jgi:hypothetical protein
LNRRILGIRYWVGLCINRKLFAEELGYFTDQEVGKVGGAMVALKSKQPLGS